MTNYRNKCFLVTGACGFIGSHIVDQLIENRADYIIALDDLSSGTRVKYIEKYQESGKLEFHKVDIRHDRELRTALINSMPEIDTIIHLAAQPSVPISVKNPRLDFETNVIGSFNLLEIARQMSIREFVFAASGGTIYGEAKIRPTPEDYPKLPISNYGAAKGAFELYLSSYSHLYGIKSSSLRFGNVFGERSLHGVIHDFFVKLMNNDKELEILGDGSQIKSYLYIRDCIEGFMRVFERKDDSFKAFNMASSPPIDVTSIANKISSRLKIKPKYSFTGGKRGWKGDVAKGELDCTRLEDLGWKQQFKFEEGLENYLNWLQDYYNYQFGQ